MYGPQTLLEVSEPSVREGGLIVATVRFLIKCYYLFTRDGECISRAVGVCSAGVTPSLLLLLLCALINDEGIFQF